MKLHPTAKTVLSLFTGPGGTEVGLRAAGYHATDAVEMDPHACATIRANHPDILVHSGDIRTMRVSQYSRNDHLVGVYTYPCDHYANYSNVHAAQTGDDLYLHALRNQALLWPEVILIENVIGMRKFPVVMELWRSLPHYYCTEFTVYGHDYTMMRKARCFLILHRQPFNFPDISVFAQSHDIPLDITLREPGQQLSAYLERQDEMDQRSLDDVEIIDSIGTRVAGGYARDAKLYDAGQTDIINLPTNYKRDRTVALVADPTSRFGYRPFSHREIARLHGYPDHYHFSGGKVARFRQVVDSVMPPVAYTLGYLLNLYFEAIDAPLPQPKALGYRMVNPRRQNQLGTVKELPDIVIADIVQPALFG